MLGGRAKLPVLAEISGPGPDGDARVWSLRRTELQALVPLQADLGEHRVALVVGDEALVGAVGLAGAAAAAGRRVALVECDLARPRLAADLGLAAIPGLHEYLRWETTAPELLQPLALAGPAAGGSAQPLICVVAGRPASKAEALVELESFRHAVAKLRGAYDLVVLIGPPPGGSAGALEGVARRADTVLVAASPAALAGQPGRLLRGQLRGLPVKPKGAIAVAG